MLDINTLQYLPRALVASALYILLCYHFGQASKQDISQRFPLCPSFLDLALPFNDLFAHFLTQSFTFHLADLLPTIQYLATFMAVDFDYTLPTATATHNPNNVHTTYITYIYRITLKNSYHFKHIILDS